MERRPDPTIPAILWLCAAAVVHYSSYQGAATVAEVGHSKLELRQFAAAVRGLVKAPDDAMEVTFVDPTAPESTAPEPPQPPPTPTAPKPEKKPEAKKPDEKKPEAKKPDEKPPEKKLDLLKPPPTPPPPKPPPPPPPDKRVAVQQHVDDKKQKDNPDAKQIADDANHVKDETQARITSRDRNDKDPSPGANAGPSREVGNADKTKVADSEDRPGSDKMPPGEKSPKNDPIVKSPKAPQAPNTSEAKPATAPPGQNGRSGPAEPARPAPTAPPPPTAPPQPPAASPDTKDSPKGNYVINPFRSGETNPAASSSAAPPAPTAKVPIYSLPKLGGQPGPKGGVNFNLTPGAAIAAIGVETIKRERELDGERRKSAHRGNWKASPIDKWRASIENYVASVKPGNTTALNTARVPFATFLNHIHNRLHPIFADDFLWSLNDLPKDHALNRKLSTSLEVVVDGERGSIVRMGITKTSGVTAFDIAALDAMERASGGSGRGFGKPPPAILSPDGNVYLHWEFHRTPEVACTTGNARPFILKTPPNGSGSPATPPRAPEVPTERGKTGQGSGVKPGNSG
jgi:hypothetical protein